MRSWLALLSVLVVCALGACFLREPALPAERIRAGVNQFWWVQDTQVQFQGEEMRVSVRFPRGARLRQKQWTYPLVRWLGGRTTSVGDGTAGTSIPDPLQVQPNPIDPNRDRDYWETFQSLKMQRYGQKDLDQKFGLGSALLLIDLESVGSHSDLPPHSLGDYDDYNTRRWLPGAFRISRIHACLVVSSPDQVESAQRSVRPALDETRGDDLRVMVIR